MPPSESPPALGPALGPRPGRSRDAGDRRLGPVGEPGRGGDILRKLILFLAVIGVGGSLGFLLSRVPPTLVLGGVLGLASVTVILLRPYLGLLIYAVVFLVRPGEQFPMLAALHLERVVGGVTLAALALRMIRREGRLSVDGTRQSLYFLLFLAVCAVGMPFSYWPGRSTELIVDFLKIGAFYLMIVHLVDTRRRLVVFIVLYLALILYLGYSSLHGYYTGNIKFAQGIERAVGTTSAGGDPNALGGTLGNTLPILLLLGLATRNWGVRLLAWGSGIVLLVWPLLLTGSRASVLGLVAVVGMFWLWSRNKFLFAFLALALLAGAFTVLPEEYKTRYASITSQELDASSQGRITAWKRGALMVIDRPLFGVGIGCFGVANANRYSGERVSWLESHSLYVQVPAETGLLGALTFGLFVVHMLRGNRRLRRELRDRRPGWRFEGALLDGVFAGLCFLLVFSVFGHSLYRYTWYVYAAIGVAVLRLHRDLPEEETALPAPAEAGDR